MEKMEHMQADDFIKYLDTEDSSDEYLEWMEHVQEHLETCGYCQHMLRRALLADSLEDEDFFQKGLRIVRSEEEIRKSLLLEHLEELGRRQRQEQLADAVRKGLLWSREVTLWELMQDNSHRDRRIWDLMRREEAASRAKRQMERRARNQSGACYSYYLPSVGPRNRENQMEATVRWEDRRIRVEIKPDKPGDVYVLLNPESGGRPKPLCGVAKYDPDTRMAQIKFVVPRPVEKYQLYLEPIEGEGDGEL